MKVLKNRVYLDLPETKERVVTISPELQKQLDQEEAAKYDKLKVFAVGVKVEDVQEGDEVFVDPLSLKRTFIIDIEGQKKIVVPDHDILHVW